MSEPNLPLPQGLAEFWAWLSGWTYGAEARVKALEKRVAELEASKRSYGPPYYGLTPGGECDPSAPCSVCGDNPELAKPGIDWAIGSDGIPRCSNCYRPNLEGRAVQ